MFNLSISYLFYTQVVKPQSVRTQIYKKQNIHKNAGIVNHSVDLSIPTLKKKVKKKGMDKQ